MPKPKEVSIPAVVSAAIGAQTFSRATCDISHEDRVAVARVLKPDVESWRASFAQKLRETGEELLDLTRAELSAIPPAARAYTLAVLIDNASALRSRLALLPASPPASG